MQSCLVIRRVLPLIGEVVIMISKRIRELMINKGLNIPEFARELGENRYRIQNILNKKQKVPEDVIIKMVEVFNVNATWLITGNGPIYS
ncbi:MAG: helix-turn-helix transcriptional regulator [Pseudomonadota bacterium]